MTIVINDPLPESEFKVLGSNGPESVSVSDVFKGKRVVVFAVPGAFTPTCHLNHLPGYLENLDEIKAAGIDDVCVISVNDVWVMDAWANATGGKGKLRFLADGDGKFTQSIGMLIDTGKSAMGVRSKRYSMIVDDGFIKSWNIEELPGRVVSSGASVILDQLIP